MNLKNLIQAIVISPVAKTYVERLVRIIAKRHRLERLVCKSKLGATRATVFEKLGKSLLRGLRTGSEKARSLMALFTVLTGLFGAIFRYGFTALRICA